MVAFPALDRPLQDERIALRFGSERDIPEILIAYQDDPEMSSRLGEARPPSGAELGRAAERASADRAAGVGAVFAIVELGFDDCRGEVRVHRVDEDGGRAELGVWVAPQVRGRGYATSGLSLASAWLLRESGLERLTLVTEPDNEPMLRAAGAAGFVREGLLRGYTSTRERGRRVDCVVMSMLPSDLEAR